MPSTADRWSHIFRFLLFCCFYKGQSGRPEGYKWRYYIFWFWLRVVIRWMSTLSKFMQVIRRNCFKIVFLASSANILWQCLISSCLLTISHFKLLTVWPTLVAAFIFPGAAKGFWWYTWAKGEGGVHYVFIVALHYDTTTGYLGLPIKKGRQYWSPYANAIDLVQKATLSDLGSIDYRV